MKRPFLSTAFSENGKKAKKRFEKILDLKNKRTGVIIMIGIAAAILIIGSIFTVNNENIDIIGGADGTTSVYVSQSSGETLSAYTDLDAAISEKMLADNQDSYLSGETRGEGHIILEVDETAGKAYVLTTYGEYGFENGKMIKCGGSGVIPRVAYYTADNGNFTVTAFETPTDGSYHVSDIKKMFPAHLQKRCLGDNYEEDYKTMLAQERVYVEKYLKEIGREAEIGEHEGGYLLTDLGVSVEVSNSLLENEKNMLLWKYPITVGNCEYIEDGVRVIYELNYKKGDSDIIYRKTRYDNGELLDEFIFDAKTGELRSALNTPSKN